MKKNLLVFTFCLMTNSIIVPKVGNEDSYSTDVNYQQVSEQSEISNYPEIAKDIELYEGSTAGHLKEVLFSNNELADVFSGINEKLYEIQHIESKKIEEEENIETAEEVIEEETAEEVEPITMYASTRVNFRTLPSTESEVIEVLPPNHPVLVTGMEGEWASVVIGEQTGYVHSAYLSNEEIPPANRNRWHIELSDEEINILANIVWLESRGETTVGQEAVVEVVLNRVVSGQYPNSVYDVLSQRGQFTSWRSVYNASPTSKEFNSIQNVLNGNTNHTTIQTLYFSTRPRNTRISAQIGNHFFCEG